MQADGEYQWCSPAHCASAATIAPDGRRMSINVEIVGSTMMVQHYVGLPPAHQLRRGGGVRTELCQAGRSTATSTTSSRPYGTTSYLSDRSGYDSQPRQAFSKSMQR